MEIREKEKVFLLDAPISQTGLFGEAVSSVVEKFSSVKSQSAALKQFMPRRMRDPQTLSPCPESTPYQGRSPPAGAAPRLFPPDYGLGSPRLAFSPPTTPQTGGPEAGLGPEDVHKVHGCCSGPFEAPGHLCTQLPGRLAHTGPLQGVSELSQRYCPPQYLQDLQFQHMMA